MAIVKSLEGIRAPRFGRHCYFSEGAVIVGDVEMGDDCTVWFNTVLRGDVHFIRVGNRTNIQDNSCIHTLNGKAPCILGDDVTIGHSVTLHGCEVKDGALVGMGATVLDHAVVGRGAIVAAGALVLSNTVIGDGELWGGVPAKFIKRVDAEQALNSATEKFISRFEKIENEIIAQGKDINLCSVGELDAIWNKNKKKT